MVDNEVQRERLLAEVEDNGEYRRVWVVEGPSLALFERSSGPVTEVAYGSPSHGHKMLCDWDACARVLGVERSHVIDALAREFSQDNDTMQLSDMMDLFDRAGEHYSYMAWSGNGDAAYRP